MELRPKSYKKVAMLVEKGVDIPNPLTLDIGEEVNIDQISGTGVKIYPGCRIYGGRTVIAAGARIGAQGPVTIEDCQIGPGVELHGGYFTQSVFLEKSSMGLGAHVREGCIVEEEASGAHCVGLKQTILFPFVTLGSLINFCDCLMAGGTNRQNHSEVGSSYIHFNFTPDGDKATPSLIGDVPRGVMLNQPPIFLGGQGGIVGPVRMGYGNVVAAGTILRHDVFESNKLIVGKSHRGMTADFVPRTYHNLSRIVENNILYMANLLALEQWYIHVRKPFFETRVLGEFIYEGALHKLELAIQERMKRLEALSENIADAPRGEKVEAPDSKGRREFRTKIQQLFRLFYKEIIESEGAEFRDRFLDAFYGDTTFGRGYIDAVQNIPTGVSKEGVKWLAFVVNKICRQASAIMPSMELFKR